ncbi:HTH-type transcriptional activator AllS [Vibrio stylophorae]|uniref:HTH-type transcriptional activator AllS n=1 Tax=Vibrio stylophorae TaxID=659351 RepID=A0ABN8DWB6_9VIBR|nr:DNA-binding transcriptional activator PunR [Vibrio stylophorae]CAH0534322.1 HTH-type transcriptional activator AllS [Vibrio stylophorae]
MFSVQSLELVDMVARLGSFSAAAQALNKVPSAVSYNIRQIEQQLDVVLFRRLPRHVELTPAGELFVQEARGLLRQMAEIRSQTQRMAQGWQDKVCLTLDNVVKLERLKQLIDDFYRTFPFAELQINMEVFNGTWEALAQQRADIVIGATAAIPVSGDYGVVDMGELNWTFVLAADHPLAEMDVLTESDVSQYSAICLDDTSRELPKRHTWHYPQQRRLLLPNWFSAIHCLRQGVGVGYMPSHIAAPLLASGELVARQLPESLPPSRCCMAWRQAPNNKLVQWLVSYLGNSAQLYQDWLA